MAAIAANARAYAQKYERSGIKTYDRQFTEINDIIRQVEALDLQQQTAILEELGVHPLWYEDHAQVPDLIGQILQP